MSSSLKTEKTIVAIVVCVVAAGVVGVALSLGWHHGKAKVSCYALRKQIDGAKETWGMDHHKTTNDIPLWSDLVGPDLYLEHLPVCPAGGSYSIGKVGERATCTYQHTYR